MKTAIPKGETLRHLLTNTQGDTLKLITNKDKLIERGYKAEEITSIIRQYPFHNHTQLTKNNNKAATTPPVVLPVKFSPICKDIREILYTYWPDIEHDTLLNSIFPNKPMIAYKLRWTC